MNKISKEDFEVEQEWTEEHHGADYSVVHEKGFPMFAIYVNPIWEHYITNEELLKATISIANNTAVRRIQSGVVSIMNNITGINIMDHSIQGPAEVLDHKAIEEHKEDAGINYDKANLFELDSVIWIERCCEEASVIIEYKSIKPGQYSEGNIMSVKCRDCGRELKYKLL